MPAPRALFPAVLAIAATALVTAPASPASAADDGAGAVVRLTNAARAAHGCGPLKPSRRLAQAARAHAEDMAARGYFSHTSADGRTWDRRIRDAGYARPGAENIAYGQASAAEVVGDWLASPGHRRNILDCSLHRIGVGHAAAGDFWVQDFGR